MRLVTRETRARSAARRWREHWQRGYPRADGSHWSTAIASQLDAATSADEVDALIGDDTWTRPGACDVCGVDDSGPRIEVCSVDAYDDDGGYDRSTHLCMECARKVAALVPVVALR